MELSALRYIRFKKNTHIFIVAMTFLFHVKFTSAFALHVSAQRYQYRDYDIVICTI